jgi:ABC-2 type transport system permease protein
MNTLKKITWTELKLYLREPIGSFFTLAFPLLLLILFGGIFGNEALPGLNGRGQLDLTVPGYIGMIIGTIGMIGLPVTVASYRENGILRRFQATPIQPGTILWAQVFVSVLITFLGTGLLLVAGKLLYDLALPVVSWQLIIAIVLSGLSFFAIGFVLAGVMPTPRAAQATGMALFYPMLFLSGAAIPRFLMPETVQRIADFLPLTHVVKLIEGLWLSGTWNLTSLTVIIGLFLLSLFISSRTFRWE